jgi:hypothetical protein
MSNAILPQEVAWHIISRTTDLCHAWRVAGVKPLDTFVGLDGSLHLFPSMPACWQLEMPSFTGDEIFDSLLVDDTIPNLGQLLCAMLPRSVFGFTEFLKAHGNPANESAEPIVPPEVQAFLDGPRTTTNAAPVLAALVRDYFPKTHARHRRVYQSLGCDPDTYGLTREARVLKWVDSSGK